MKLKRHNVEAIRISVEFGQIVVYTPDQTLFFGKDCTVYDILKAVTRTR